MLISELKGLTSFFIILSVLSNCPGTLVFQPVVDKNSSTSFTCL